MTDRMKFKYTVTVRMQTADRSNAPVSIPWCRTDDLAVAIAAMGQAAVQDIGDENLPESVRTRLLEVTLDIRHEDQF